MVISFFPSIAHSVTQHYEMYLEVELGLGIHGEPGVRRHSLQTADDTVKGILDHILTKLKVSPILSFLF